MFCPTCSGRSNEPCATQSSCDEVRERDRLRGWFDEAMRHSMLELGNRESVPHNAEQQAVQLFEEM